MASKFRDPAPREDIRAGVDWHFYVFRHQNAVAAVQFTVIILDHLVSVLDRGGEELAKCKPLARERMDAIFGAYEQVEALPKIQRTQEKQPDETGDARTARSGRVVPATIPRSLSNDSSAALTAGIFRRRTRTYPGCDDRHTRDRCRPTVAVSI